MMYGGVFTTAFLITFFITPVVIQYAKKHKLVDDAKKRYHPASIHTGIIPRAGGLAIYIGLSVSVLFFLGFSKITIGILIAGLIFTVIGLLDDRKDVNPYIRIATNSIAILIAISAGIGVPYITNPLTGGIIPFDQWRISFSYLGSHSILVWADLFAFLWITWTTNSVGWSAGVDGQMPGFVSIAALFLGFLSLRGGTASPDQQFAAILSFIVSGIYAGFTPWNFFPQKIQPGYSGKTLAGFLLGVLGILSYAKVGTALLVLGIPSIDAAYTLFRRIRHGHSPVLPDKNHLHHTLLKLGWGKRRIALFYWLVSAILGTVALTVTSKEKFFTFLFVIVIFVGFVLWVQFFTQLSKPPDQDNG